MQAATMAGRCHLHLRWWLSILLFTALLVNAIGCNSSRYGVGYDDRLAQIRTVAVVPASIEVYSLHSGGVLEARPDECSRASARTVAEVASLVRDRGREAKPLDGPKVTGDSDHTVTGKLALLAAVRDAISTHHYQHGKNLIFDYEIADASSALVEEEVDAVLCVYLQAAIPTGGRSMLKATAFAVGLLTGIHIHVKTNEIFMALLLVDRATGKVLWFNQCTAEASVTRESDLRRAVKKGCAYLLKPREGG